MSDINCPYCDKEQDINHDDGRGYLEDELHRQECDCGKTFIFTTSLSYYYEPYKADCLNGGEHDWHPTHTYPKRFTKMQCSMCAERREMTEDELNKIMEDG